MTTGQSFARNARCYLRAKHLGVLATLSQRLDGHPYGSVVPFVLDHHAKPIILVSRLAEHTRNMEMDPRVSLVVHDDGTVVQARPRLTVIGDATRIDCDRFLRERYLRYQPDAQEFLELGDFSFWQISPRKLYFVAGFGSVRWISASDYRPPMSLPPPLEAQMIAQMNSRGSEALRLWCARAADRAVSKALMLGIDCDGFDVGADDAPLRHDFPRPATNEQSLRRALPTTAAVHGGSATAPDRPSGATPKPGD